MSDAVVENLILAIEEMGIPEAVAAVDELSASVDELSASLDRADVAAAGGASKKGGLMGALTGMKALFAGLGVYESIKSFAGFQSQMEKLRTQTGATQIEVSRMSKGILEMAVSVGTGPQSLAEALYHIESAGYRGQKALDALRIAAQGAQIGGADLTSTTTGLTAVMVAGFHGINTLQKAMGALNATVGAGDMSFEDLNSALSTGVLATFKAAGLQVNDFGAALAVLGDNNIRGSKAARTLEQAIHHMLGPSEKAQAVLKKLGMAPLQMAEDLRKPNGLLVALSDLKKHLGSLAPTERENAIQQIFTSEGSKSMLTLLEQLDRLKTKYGAVSNGAKDFNKDWAATTKTLQFFMNEVKTLAEVVLIKLGSKIKFVAEGLKDFAEGLQHGKLWADALAGVLLALGALMVVAKVRTMELTVATEAWDLVSGMNPWVLVLMGVVVALTLVATHFKQVKEVAVDAWHWIETAAVKVFDWIKGHWPLLAGILLGPIGFAIAEAIKHFGAVEHAAQSVWNWITKAWGKLGGILAWPFVHLWDIAKDVSHWIVKAFEWVGKHLSSLLNHLGPLGALVKVGSGIVGGALKFGGEVLGGLADGGPVSASGSYLVGERGPEIVYLPRGAHVQPNHELGSALTNALAPLASAMSGRDLNVNLVVDRRVLSRAVIREGLEGQSRR